VCSDFAKQIIDMEKGKREPVLYVGNTDAVRDFTDVRDVVRGYWLSLERGRPGEVYNICSGVGRKISDVLKMLTQLSGIKFKVVQEERRMRPSDVPVLVGDNSKFCRETGWKPLIPFEQTLKDLLEFWRSKQ
jgi:GDP-4-dehydro-6-deoxy-D-mannose reductase